MSALNPSRTEPAEGRPAALRFVLLLGVVGLFANAAYEGAHSSIGPFLAGLGATGFAVGLVAGLGELTSYGLRLLSGYAADRTGRYWTILLVGYAVNMAAVPLLALAGHWHVAAAVLLAERLGKGIRTPARDALLAHACRRVGAGVGFGIHEVLDQAGAVAGPLVFALILLWGGGYRIGFLALAVPAVLTLLALALLHRLYPHPETLDNAPTTSSDATGLPRTFWLVLAATSLIAAGFVDFPLIAYHLARTGAVAPHWVPVAYAVAMATAAAGGLLAGRFYDRFGVGVLAIVAVVAAGAAPVAFIGGPIGAVCGMALWGAALGATKIIVKAAVATAVPAGRRGTAYGLTSAAFGVAWFLGSVGKGGLYDISPAGLVAASVVLQLAAVPVLFLAGAYGVPQTERRSSSALARTVNPSWSMSVAGSVSSDVGRSFAYAGCASDTR